MRSAESTARVSAQSSFALLGRPASESTRVTWLETSRHHQTLGMIWHDRDESSPDFGETHAVLTAPVHTDAVYLCDIWELHQLHGGLHVRRHVPSRALSPILAHLSLYEPLHGGLDFRVRLAGSAWLRRFGFEATGRLLSQVFEGEGLARRYNNMRQLLVSGLPYALDVKSRTGFSSNLHFEIVSLPVIAPDGNSRWVMSGLFYYDWCAKTQRPPQMSPAFCGMASA